MACMLSSKESERICKSYESLVKELLEQKELLLCELNTTLEAHQQLLISRTNALETLLLDANNCCEFLDTILQHGNETEVRTRLEISTVRSTGLHLTLCIVGPA